MSRLSRYRDRMGRGDHLRVVVGLPLFATWPLFMGALGILGAPGILGTYAGEAVALVVPWLLLGPMVAAPDRTRQALLGLRWLSLAGLVLLAFAREQLAPPADDAAFSAVVCLIVASLWAHFLFFSDPRVEWPLRD